MRSSPTIRPIGEALKTPNDPRFFEAPEPELQLRADPSRREAAGFKSGGISVAAHLYRPSGHDGERHPALIVPGPISSVKEQTVPHYAERLAAAGYLVLTFDPRHLGESEGEPRGLYDPNLVIEDLVAAVSHLVTHPDVDPERIGIVGICFGGGLGISAAARDKRVKAVASVAGGYAIGASFQMLMGAEAFAGYVRTVNDLVQRERETGEVAYVPTIAHALDEATPIAFMAGEEAYAYYERTARTEAPSWNPRTPVAGLESYYAYSTIPHAPLVDPAPLLVVHGSRDLACFPEFAQAVYAAATGPKEQVWIESHNHIEFYDQDPYVSEAVGAVTRWLARSPIAASRPVVGAA